MSENPSNRQNNQSQFNQKIVKRPFWKMKRFIIPVIIFILFVITGSSGGKTPKNVSQNNAISLSQNTISNQSSQGQITQSKSSNSSLSEKILTTEEDEWFQFTTIQLTQSNNSIFPILDIIVFPEQRTWTNKWDIVGSRSASGLQRIYNKQLEITKGGESTCCHVPKSQVELNAKILATFKNYNDGTLLLNSNFNKADAINARVLIVKGQESMNDLMSEVQTVSGGKYKPQ